MKKIFTTAFLSLIFCATLFAKDYVVTKTIGTVQYETSTGVWETLKTGTKVTDKTMVNVFDGALLELKGKNDKVYSMGYMNKVSVGEAIKNIGNKKKKSPSRVTDKGLVEVAITPEHIEEIYSHYLRDAGFDPIKKLPAGKNVIRLEATSWGHAIVELAWTESSASIVHFEEGIPYGDVVDWDEGDDEKSEIEINKNYVEKILNLIKKTDFYNQSGYVYRPGYSMRDGEVWYIEANINGVYKSIHREMPRETFLKELGELLLNR